MTESEPIYPKEELTTLEKLGRWFLIGMIPVAIFTFLGFVITSLATVSSMSLQEVIIALSQILVGMIVTCVVIVGIGMVIDAMIGYNDQ